MKENGFTLKMARKQYPVKTITDADSADDLALIASTPTQAKSVALLEASSKKHQSPCELI